MKKLIILFAAAAMMLPLASCKKQDQPAPKEVVMEPAATAEVAQIISFEDAPGENPIYLDLKKKVNYEVLSIEITEGSRCIVRRRPIITESSSIPATKAGGAIEIVVGNLAFIGGKLVCTGSFVATIEIKNGIATISFEGGSAKNYAAAVTKPAPSGSTQNTNASRTWEVASSIINISGGGIGVQTGFKGCDFHEIAQFAKNSGASLDPEKVAGYSITEIIFTQQKTFSISFSGGYTFYGTYQLNGENVSCSITSGALDIVGQSASGTLTFPAKGKAVLSLSTSVKNYSASVEFEMNEID